jgi:uncharacterized protein
MKKRQIGVISDTHGLVRPEALNALKGSELIIHAGDVGKPEVLESLRNIAPVVAVRGNVDTGPWTRALRVFETVKFERIWFFVIHDVTELNLDPAAAAFRGVIHGHSHRPSIQTRNGVLFLNPGSAGPKRFHLPVTVALLSVTGTSLEPQLIELEIAR